MTTTAWRYYARFYRKSYPALFLSVIASIGGSFVLFPIALLLRQVLDDALPARDTTLLLRNGGLLLALYLINSAVTLWTRHTTLKVTKVAIGNLREELVRRIQTFPRNHYSQLDLRRLHANVVEDTERLDVMSNALVAQLLPAIVTGIVLGAVLVGIDWSLFLLFLVSAPMLFVASRLLGRGVQGWVRAFRYSFETFSQGVMSALQRLDLTRIQSTQAFEIERQRSQIEDLRRISGSMAWLQSAYASVNETIIATSGVIVLIVGGYAVLSGEMTVGGLIAFYVVLALLKQCASTTAFTVPQIIAGNESLRALFDIVRIQHPQPYTGRKQIKFKGSVNLRAVSFGYNDAMVLREVDLVVHPHEMVAITGPNGAGKSTIVNLILGFYRPDRGVVYADEHPLDNLDLVHLRRQIGVVTQDPMILPGTVAENIAYGCPDADLEDIIRAARMATAHEFIVDLPWGYDTFVGEAGILVSGGQRQRLALARALLGRPALLLLDEPTNHLDDASVRRLLRNLKELRDVPAIVIISHNPEIVREAQRLYMLEEGRIVVGRDRAASEDISSSIMTGKGW